jgi:hypothetical protein
MNPPLLWWPWKKAAWRRWSLKRSIDWPPLIDLFLEDGSSEAAFVSFDSKPQLEVPFTKDADRLGHELKRMEPGDGGAAILDSVGFLVKLLGCPIQAAVWA